MKNRLKELDIVRSIAFIFVVAQHILGGYSNIKGLPYIEYIILKACYIIAKPAVPIFLCISAISFIYVYWGKIDVVSYYKKRILYVVIPYIIWSAINMVRLKHTDRFSNFALQLIAGNGEYHLWYMGMIIRLFIYFPIILILAKKISLKSKKFKVIILCCSFAGYYFISKYQSAISTNIGKLLLGNPSRLQQKAINVSPLFWILYVIIGVYISLNYKKFINVLSQHKVLIIILYIPLLTYSFLNEINKVKFIRAVYILFTTISILIVFMISLRLIRNKVIYKFMMFISKYSFSAYMIHVMVLQYIAGKLLIKDRLLSGIIILILTVIISPLIIMILNFMPFSQYITGCRKRSSIISTDS